MEETVGPRGRRDRSLTSPASTRIRFESPKGIGDDSIKESEAPVFPFKRLDFHRTGENTAFSDVSQDC
ncbi:hypothetical protein WN48_09304 [Eufriesea mexicana]|uniref:Uncharacterized protein n=1 Tax=Eufriesea mexicana TaxID=516756 RepID=A0A310SN46_9HYME|nr:hypothetical protein WN48_09304 [Eufriesea mexicana]